MSTNRQATVGTVAVPSDGNPAPQQIPTPTVTHYQQLADNVLKLLDEVAAAIPNLEAPHPATATFVRTHQNVPMDFLGTAIAAVEQTQELRNLNKLDIASARDTLQFIEAFRPVLDKIDELFAAVRNTLGARKAALAADSLQIYSIAKGLARDPGATGVASHVANLKRDLGRRRRSKAAAASQSTPAPKAVVAT